MTGTKENARRGRPRGPRGPEKVRGLAYRAGFLIAMNLAWGAAIAADAVASVPVAPMHAGLQMHESASSLDVRVRRLARALDLSPPQQEQLRSILLKQEDQVRQAWADNSVPSSYRVLATRVISDQTADRIRAILNDEQKKKYNPPRLVPPPR